MIENDTYLGFKLSQCRNLIFNIEQKKIENPACFTAFRVQVAAREPSTISLEVLPTLEVGSQKLHEGPFASNVDEG